MQWFSNYGTHTNGGTWSPSSGLGKLTLETQIIKSLNLIIFLAQIVVFSSLHRFSVGLRHINKKFFFSIYYTCMHAK